MPGSGAEGARERGGVRGALGGLTTRGRSFLAAGLAAAVCAYLLGQGDLLRVGLLLAVLPLLCVLFLHRTRHRVEGSRRLTPAQVSAGSEARVTLRVDSVSRLPTGVLMLQDKVPYVLGPRPRFLLDRVEPGGRREVSYRVRSDLRGRYALGPLQLRLTDPFGMCELDRAFSGQSTLTVVPRVERLPPLRPGGEARGFGEGRQHTLALAGEDDLIPRGYRHGDDLRRVHWRSTARLGELMVRREEQPQRAGCTVLLDTRAAGYAGSGPGSAFEWAVSGVASALLHLLEKDIPVRLVTDTGDAVPAEGSATSHGGRSGQTAALMMDLLAVVGHSDGAGLSRAHEALGESGEALLVAFLGDLDEEQTTLTARMRRPGSTAVAFLLDSAVWAGGDGSALDARARRLREAGWAVVPVPPGVPLAPLWGGAAAPGPAAGPRPRTASTSPGGAA
ncbi:MULTISPECIES: DUF58 domain-containing protein [Streptomyces]|uniref:DUF58 domain-containing protein n=1 Tax=Streptomyces TaxID=1883 RepID=UPI002094EEE4|nr:MULTISPECIES: DUF58 domain-containing protein [Streptomyces]MCO6697603.1 DUF58 domain-containing protein [Streptomyces sp. Vc17.3-30]WST11030.1 DUF58 domain-containing protein [Streptomyces albidoflavus]WTC41127.1 DUF58 domain-containing protein [Streptomyces albidoflavus]WTD44449.1 DUF58 domain-containing protein [Streptomyces albidoflavus]WTD81280.1 DUF58 domain-containing protein [Streptomyces albidoflavus]